MNRSDIAAMTVRNALGNQCPCWNILESDLSVLDDDYTYFHLQVHAELIFSLEGINGFSI